MSYGDSRNKFDGERKSFGGRKGKPHDKDRSQDKGKPQERELNSDEIIYGRNPVMEAIKNGTPINKLVVLDGETNGSLKSIIAKAREAGILITFADRRSLDRISGGNNHQGVVAYISPMQYSTVDDILARAKEKNEDPFIIILDEIQDPHNLGAIIRTADAVGAHGVIIPMRRACAMTGTVAKTSAGAFASVLVARVSNLGQTIDRLKEQGIWVAGTDLKGETKFYNANLKGPLAIVIGSEGFGTGPLITSKCDFMLSMPMVGSVTSLNASVAAGIVLYEAFRQRNGESD